MEMDPLTGKIIAGAMRVHSRLGPGVLESAYETCLAHECAKRGLKVVTQVELPIVYDGIVLEVGYRLDLLIEDTVVVELKTVKNLTAIHDAQLLSYLRLSGHKVGLLINFHVPRLADGIKRMVNNWNLDQ
jgi:GxxExxY protein